MEDNGLYNSHWWKQKELSPRGLQCSWAVGKTQTRVTIPNKASQSLPVRLQVNSCWDFTSPPHHAFLAQIGSYFKTLFIMVIGNMLYFPQRKIQPLLSIFTAFSCFIIQKDSVESHLNQLNIVYKFLNLFSKPGLFIIQTNKQKKRVGLI